MLLCRSLIAISLVQDHFPLIQFNPRARPCDSENRISHTHLVLTGLCQQWISWPELADETADLQRYQQQTVMSSLLYFRHYLIVVVEIVSCPKSVVTAVGGKTSGLLLFHVKPRCRTYHVRSVLAGWERKRKKKKNSPVQRMSLLKCGGCAFELQHAHSLWSVLTGPITRPNGCHSTRPSTCQTVLDHHRVEDKRRGQIRLPAHWYLSITAHITSLQTRVGKTKPFPSQLECFQVLLRADWGIYAL